MNVATNFIERKTRRTNKFIWLLVLTSFVSICITALIPSSAHAQFGTDVYHCEWEWTEVDGEWLPGSTTVDCTNVTMGYSTNDGSEFLDQVNNSCGLGNPCPEAPEDTDEAITEEQICQVEQAAESIMDQIMQATAEQIRFMDPKKEHLTFVVEIDGALQRLNTIATGDENYVSPTELLAEMLNRNISAYQIRGVIHNHPPRSDLSGAALDATNFISGFPSLGDADGFQSYSNVAVSEGGDRAQFESTFRYFVIDAYGTLREYEPFNSSRVRPPNWDGPGFVIPIPGEKLYDELVKLLEEAALDAEGDCQND